MNMVMQFVRNLRNSSMTAQPVLSDWIGRREQNSDVVSLRQAVGMAAMFDLPDEPVLGEPLPPGWHWMFFAEIARQSVLSKDGHAPRGGFLPPRGFLYGHVNSGGLPPNNVIPLWDV